MQNLSNMIAPILNKVKEISDIMNGRADEEGDMCVAQVVDVCVINSNAFFITFEWNYGEAQLGFYESKLFISEDGFKTQGRDYINLEEIYMPNLVGELNFTIDRNGGSVCLDNIEVGKGLRHNGYGKLLMKYFINLINNNSKVNCNKKCAKITGVFAPHKDADRDVVNQFYQGFGADPEMLENGLIRINLNNEGQKT